MCDFVGIQIFVKRSIAMQVVECMKNLAISTIYGNAYLQDKLFDNSTCFIGENLLMPNIILKKQLEQNGFSVHTIDTYSIDDVDYIIFLDVQKDSIKTISSPAAFLKYLLKRKWKTDYFSKAMKKIPKENRFLILSEPPTVNPASYRKKFHAQFHRVLTWSDALVNDKLYFKYSIPQYVPEEKYNVEFQNRKLLTMICGNKSSRDKNELYTRRRRLIDYFENKPDVFDLYGFGWEKEKLRNFKGKVDKKLQVLSQYKFSICFENIKNQKGYITEKIFDCFFAGVVPIYLGADNIVDYIPENTFIDMRQFQSIDELYHNLLNLSEEDHKSYLTNIQTFLNSRAFFDNFSVDAYVNRIKEVFFGIPNELNGTKLR